MISKAAHAGLCSIGVRWDVNKHELLTLGVALSDDTEHEETPRLLGQHSRGALLSSERVPEIGHGSFEEANRATPSILRQGPAARS